MSSELKAFRQEQARLRDRQRRLSNQSENSTYVGMGLGAAGVGLAFIPGLPVVGAVVLAAAYFVPAVAISIASLQLSNQLEKVNEELLTITADIGSQSEYEQLIELSDSSTNEATQNFVANVLVTRHMDSVIRDSVREIGRQIETRDFREHYDHVDPPDFDRDWGGGFDNDSGGSMWA